MYMWGRCEGRGVGNGLRFGGWKVWNGFSWEMSGCGVSKACQPRIDGGSASSRSPDDVPLLPPAPRLGACLRSLSALAAASRKEDRYGVLLLCEPGLSDVLVTLASAVLALQQYTKSAVSHRSLSSHVLISFQEGDITHGPFALQNAMRPYHQCEHY